MVGPNFGKGSSKQTYLWLALPQVDPDQQPDAAVLDHVCDPWENREIPPCRQCQGCRELQGGLPPLLGCNISEPKIGK